jgi:chromosome segregation ATPase
MKKTLLLGLGALLAIPFLSVALVFATGETGTTLNSSTNKPSQVAQTTDGTDDTETTPPDDKALLERIQKRKTELKTRLAAAEKTKLLSKCQASQGKLSSIRGRIKGIETSRAQVYKNVTNHLKNLSEKLENKGVDTAELDAAITELETKIQAFTTDLATYKQAVADLADMDCKSDPEGFKASLETARTALKKVSEDAAAVKAHVKDVIKPLLKEIRAELKKDESGDSGESEGGEE